MLSTLRSLFRRRVAPEVRETEFAPDMPFFAIGDIHGCLVQLDRMLAEIAGISDDPIVFLGDYVDRGLNSAGVLRRLYGLAQGRPGHIIALKGNHEAMLLNFVDDPAGQGAQFLQNGGVETLRSFGIDAQASGSVDDMQNWAEALETQMTADLLDWLRNLPMIWQNGNMICAHAGIDPGKGLDDQPERALLWGCAAFMAEPIPPRQAVVFGHKIVQAPYAVQGRVALDTGAYRTGWLSGAHFTHGTCRFLQVR